MSRYQVTRLLSPLEAELRQCVFCKEPLSFWFASRLRNFDLLGREYKYYASLILMPLFVGRSESESREMCAGAGTSVSSRSSVNSFNHSAKCRKRSSESRFFGGVSHQFPGASPSLRSWAGLVEDKSCNVDAKDELLPELADNLGTTSGTKLSVLHIIVFSSLANRGL